MARRPADIVAAARHPKGRDAVWAVIRRLRRMTLTTLELEASVPRDLARRYLHGLTAGGYMQVVATLPDGGLEYELVKDVGVDAPRVRADGSEVTQGRGRDQCWRAMKVLGAFTGRELAQAASTPDHRVSAAEAINYAGHLHRAGYLVMLSPPKPGAQATFRLLGAMNTGPKPPQIQRRKTVWDPNLGRVVGPRAAS